jgi:hypothetical protein
MNCLIFKLNEQKCGKCHPSLHQIQKITRNSSISNIQSILDKIYNPLESPYKLYQKVVSIKKGFNVNIQIKC